MNASKHAGWPSVDAVLARIAFVVAIAPPLVVCRSPAACLEDHQVALPHRGDDLVSAVAVDVAHSRTEQDPARLELGEPVGLRPVGRKRVQRRRIPTLDYLGRAVA